MAKKFLSIVAVLLLAAPAYAAETLTVAAASDLTYCLDDLNAAFKRTHPQADVKSTTGSSGNFFAQITNGAPFDVFLSADMSYPRELVQAGLAVESSLTLYATGHIALWTTSDKIDVGKGLAVLESEAVKKIAIASPETAPYGRAARSALQSAKLWDAIQAKLVIGENIAQTAQFVQTGNVDAGIVSLSFMKSPKNTGVGKYYEIPEDLYPTLDQGGVITTAGKDNPLAKDYIAFLRSAEAKAVFSKFGFVLPAAAKP